MARGTARDAGSAGEMISHFNAIRMRVVGTGFLKMTLYSLQDQTLQHLADFELSETTRFSPLRLANFIEQRAALQIQTHSINEYFRINRIIIYSRTYASEYPA
jgi:hypothetical protein